MIQLTSDYDLISCIGNHPSIYKYINDGLSYGIKYIPNPLYTYLNIDNEAIIVVAPLSSIMYQLHIFILPSMYGKTELIARDTCSFLFNETLCKKIIVMVPIDNRLAIRIAKKYGILEGTLKKSFLRNWELIDQEIYGLTKEEYICQQQ